MKEIIETDECHEFRVLLTEEESTEYSRIRFMLRRDGRLEYPWGEKVEGEENLFAIRIRKVLSKNNFYTSTDLPWYNSMTWQPYIITNRNSIS